MKGEKLSAYRAVGRVLDRRTGRGVKGLRVEVWDKDMLFEDFVGMSITDKYGGFQIEFTAADFNDWFLDRQPDLYFKIYRGEGLVASTETRVLWNTGASDKPVNIEIDTQVTSIGAGLGTTDIFQFVSVRPVQPANFQAVTGKYAPATSTMEKSDLHLQLADAYQQTDGLAHMVQLAQDYRASADYVSELDEVSTPLRKLIDQFCPIDRPLFHSELLHGMREIFQLPSNEHIPTWLRQYTEGDLYRSERERLGDSLLAATIDPHADPAQRDRLVQAVRMCRLLERIAAEDERLEQLDGIQEALHATVLLPGDLFPLPSRPAVRQAIPARQTGRTERTRQLEQQIDNLKTALGELDQIGVKDYVVTPPPGPEGHDKPKEPQPWILSEEAIQCLSESTRKILEEGGFDLEHLSHSRAVDYLHAELMRTGALRHIPRRGRRVVCYGGSTITFCDELERTAHFRAGATPLGGGNDAATETEGAVRQLGVADYMMVRQTLLRYELGEIAHIENALRGEYRERVHRRARLVEETLTIETERVEESERDLQTTERFELKREASETLKEESKLEAGVSVTASGPWISTTANLNYGSTTAKEEADKVASTYAREVTDRSRSRLEERVREERVRRTIEEFEERNTHGIDNKGSDEHVVGIYRWLDKVYEAQVMNYGRRMLLEFTVPEPAVFYLEALRDKAPEGLTIDVPDEPKVVVEPADNLEEEDRVWPLDTYLEEGNVWPPPPPRFVRDLQPGDIREENYRFWVSKYQAKGVSAPGSPNDYVARSFAKEVEQQGDDLEWQVGPGPCEAADLTIAPGYQADKAWCYAWLVGAAADNMFSVLLGQKSDMLFTNQAILELNQEVGKIPFAIACSLVWPYVGTVEIKCSRTAEEYADWQMKTYQSVLQAYQELKADYDEQLAAAEIQEGIRIAGRNPALNREIERIELKKSVISLLTRQRFESFGAIEAGEEGYPEIKFLEADQQAPFIRFFEQAFEWPHITYLFYPYFWGRKRTWAEKLTQIEDTDPLFEQFLKAGSARVVVPVQPGYEEAVLSYLETGVEVWRGAEELHVDHEASKSMLEDLKEQLGAGNEGVPAEDPWEVRVPTNLVMLQQDALLPGEYATYRVKPGDNLDKIAESFGTTADALEALNDLDSLKLLVAGQRLRVPAN